MTTEAKQIEVPNIEAPSDRKRIFSPKHWLEIFRQYTKEKIQNRLYRIDTGSRNDSKRLDRQRNGNTRRLHMGHRPRSIVSDDTGRIQNRTGQNSSERSDPTF